MDFDQTGMFTRAEALAAGFTDDHLRRARAEGVLTTVRRGHFMRTEVFAALDPRARHVALARAIHSESSSGVALSHVSAAVVHGMETWDIPLEKATFTVNRSYAGKRGRRRVLHGSLIDPSELTEVDGLPVTTPARTVVDLARSLPLIPAVCLGDHALRLGLTDPLELAHAVDTARSRTGIAKARHAVQLMAAAGVSVGESRSRLHLGTLPLPRPLIAQWVYDDAGTLIGRAPFLYPEHGVVGEYEGEGLHGAELTVPQLEVRLRRKRMDEMGWTIARWGWPDLSSVHTVTERIARAFVLAASRPAPSGTFASECR